MGTTVLMTGALLCALQAIRTKRLLRAAVWLSGVSGFVSLALYKLGAREIAVIELSVGAGLVTVLFVFAIAIAGEDAMALRSAVPRLLSWGLVLGALALLGGLVLPAAAVDPPPVSDKSFAEVLWHDRSLDVLLQIGVIFAGVLGVLGLLAQKEPTATAEIARADARTEALASAINAYALPWEEDGEPAETSEELAT